MQAFGKSDNEVGSFYTAPDSERISPRKDKNIYKPKANKSEI